MPIELGKVRMAGVPLPEKTEAHAEHAEAHS